MPERSDVYAYFWIEGFDSAAEVTAEMAMAPSRVQSIGDPLPSGRLVQRSTWELSSPIARGDTLIQDHLAALVEVLEKRPEAVRALVSRYSAGINCVGYYYGSNPGLHLSRELIERLSALELSVDFDLYNHGADPAP